MAVLRFLSQFWAGDDGQDLVEYTIIIAVFVLLLFSFAGYLSPYISAMWTSGNNQLASANTSAS